MTKKKYIPPAIVTLSKEPASLGVLAVTIAGIGIGIGWGWGWLIP